MFRIAICDDNKYDIKAISSALDVLRGEGVEFELTAYTDGFSLIKAFEAGTRYHLLILDMVMDSINGIETAKRIREYDVSMPILIVTSTREFALEEVRHLWLVEDGKRGDFLEFLKEVTL